jgi:hypothetical protein
MMKLRLIKREDGIYFENTDKPIKLKNGACFEVTVHAHDLEEIPEFDEQKEQLKEGTLLEFTLLGTGYNVEVMLNESLFFYFRMGKETRVKTQVKCTVLKITDRNSGLFDQNVDSVPFEVNSLHQAYGEVSRKLKPKAKHHNVNIFNCFKVLQTGVLLSKYRKNRNLF